MFKFGSIEDASKAYASGQFQKIEKPEEKAAEKPGQHFGKVVENPPPPVAAPVKQLVNTMEKKRREPPLTFPKPPPSSPVHLRQREAVVQEAYSYRPSCSLTNAPETSPLMSPQYDTFKRVMAMDGERLKEAIASTTSYKTQLEMLETYDRYVRTFH